MELAKSFIFGLLWSFEKSKLHARFIYSITFQGLMKPCQRHHSLTLQTYTNDVIPTTKQHWVFRDKNLNYFSLFYVTRQPFYYFSLEH
jgi:hypothetical protein